MHDFTSTPILHDIIISIECFYIALLLNVVVENCNIHKTVQCFTTSVEPWSDTVISYALSHIAWLCCFKGIHTRGAIESLLVTWTDCSQDFCQVVAGSEILTSIASTLHWALENEVLNTVWMYMNAMETMCHVHASGLWFKPRISKSCCFVASLWLQICITVN